MPDGPIPPAPDTGGEAGGWGGGPCRGAEEAAEKPDKPRAKKVKRMQRARFHKNRFCASSLTQAHFSSFDFPRRPLSSLFFHPGTQLPLLPSPTRGSAPPCRAGQLRGAPAAGRGGGAGAPRLPGRPSLEATPWGPGPFPPSGSPLAANIFRSLWLARVRFRMSSTSGQSAGSRIRTETWPREASRGPFARRCARLGDAGAGGSRPGACVCGRHPHSAARGRGLPAPALRPGSGPAAPPSQA